MALPAIEIMVGVFLFLFMGKMEGDFLRIQKYMAWIPSDLSLVVNGVHLAPVRFFLIIETSCFWSNWHLAFWENEGKVLQGEKEK